ncbi:peptidylprolyl isomerase [Roseomonas sp. AR75]|uniref:peptidylprolyl isomerase n=1 Tax=Roseomonas sp. AR75 TaxID=2562311 RepID=UPI001F0E91F4|nr:peptidylprolyl isomerase [Roseomonas sp. AR75]
MRRSALLLAALLLPAGPTLAQAPPAAAPAAPASPQAAAPAADPVLATVDGIAIRQSDLEAEIQRLPPELRAVPPQTLTPLLLDQLITQKALVAAARALGLDKEPEVQARIRRAEEEALQQALLIRAVQPLLTEEALRERFARESAARPPEEEIRARHILVPTEQEARAALAEVRRPGADFAEVARRRSSGPGSREGGDLGFFKRGDMIPEFAEAAFALQPGQIAAEPVRTQFGWHVIKVEARRAAPAPGYEDSREQLRQQAFEEGVNAAVERIRNAAKVERTDAAGAPRAPSLLDGAAPPPAQAPAPAPRR